MQKNNMVRFGAFLMAIGIVLGALSAHALKSKLPIESMESFKTGVLYHIIHALTLVILGFSNIQLSRIKLISWLFGLGILFFSGSIYLLSTSSLSGIDFGFLGPITPIGGLLFIAAWIFLGISVGKNSEILPK
jgi:uncharacterized membrane protein YgdD (TMEM256/DUF423 family)